MSALRKPSGQKRVRREEPSGGRISRKRQRVRSLSPLTNDDHELAPKTREKIIAELRKELAEDRAEAADAAMFKKQRDFAVHIAASFCDLQREMFVGWHADVQKLAKTSHFGPSQAGLNQLFDRAEAIENILTSFPKLDNSFHTHVCTDDLEQIKGLVEDFTVEMVEREDLAADSTASTSDGSDAETDTKNLARNSRQKKVMSSNRKSKQ
jgi:hypothetical protein